MLQNHKQTDSLVRSQTNTGKPKYTNSPLLYTQEYIPGPRMMKARSFLHSETDTR